jgi:crotonobetainyl-CoA:carnitine CoA-transferase CaiB-like acyl-CoA transferase
MSDIGPPLAGVRVLSVEQFGAGPWATMQLADLGAEVIKVEDPAGGGDVGRYVGPYQAGEGGLYFESFNRGKRSVSLDLRHAEGMAAFRRLVRGSDVVFCNLRGDVPEKLGLTYAQLRDANERIVCCALTGFGTTGPRRAEAAYDYVIQAMAGWMSLTGGPEEPPTKSGLSLVDFNGGYVAAIAILSGLLRARETGIGCDCDVSLFETALSELAYLGTWVASNGYEPERRPDSAHPSITPFQSFPTTDGWIVVACPKDHFWRALARAIGRPELGVDPRFADFAARDANRSALLAELYPLFAGDTCDTWLERLGAEGVPCARVGTIREALDDPQSVARDVVVDVEHPEFGTVRQVATPLRVDGVDRTLTRAPALGEHTAAVLAEVGGLDAAEIAELAGSGALGAVGEAMVAPR